MVKKRASKKDKMVEKKMESCCGSSKGSGCGGCAYFLGFLGSAVYYISTASGFLAGVVGVLKSLVWPAFVVYELMKFLAM